MATQVVALIPARGGSKGLPRKNIKILCGKPLIAYTIESAKQSKLINRVIVSTEDAEIASVAKQWGAEVPFLRPAELATDLAPTEPVLKHALDWLEHEEGYRADVAVFLQPTDIFRKSTIIDETVAYLLEHPDCESCFAAYPTHKNFWRKQGGQPVRLAADLAYGPRQMKEHIYREDTGIACATRAAVIKSGRRIGTRAHIIEHEEPASFVDVEDEMTFYLAEKIVQRWGYRFWPQLYQKVVV